MQTMTEATTEVIECLPSGWQDASISCAATDCGLPLAPAHSVTSVTSTTFGSTAMFMCSPGYTPTESDAANIVTCEAEGTWTNTAFSCKEIEISLSSAVGAMSTLLKLLESTTSSSSSTNGSSVSDPTDNGTLAGDSGQPLRAVVDTGDLQIGSVVTFSCIAGYQLEGNETLSVTQQGQLDGDIPLCTEIQCPEANIPVSTALNVVVSRIRVNATLSFSCDKGWLLVQTGQIRCGPDSVWHGDMPYCEVAVCSPPSSIPHGRVSSQQPGSVGARITYTCEAGYKLEDGETGTAECMPDGGWSHPPPTCEAVTCPNLPSLGPHMQMVGSSGDFGSVLVFVCNDGYVMNSSDTNVTCQHSGQWSQPNDTLACEVLDCGRPPRVENATMYHTSTVLAAVASYSCLPDYDLRAGDAKRACGVDGAWGGTDIVCTYIPGGKKVEIFVPKENLTEEEVFYESIGFKPVDRRASNFSIGTVVGITFISLTMAFFIILDMSTFQPGKCVKAAKKLCIKNSVNPV